MKRRARNIFVNATLFIGSILISAWLLNIYILKTQPVAVSMEFSPSTDFRLKPNQIFNFKSSEFNTTVTTNSHGLRGGNINSERQCQILALGDSYTFGHGVNDNETYSQQLQKKLDTAFPGTYSVINAGHNGYDNRREAAFFETFGIQLNPDLVTVGFTINDPLSNSGEYFYSPIPLNILRYFPFEGVASLLEYLRRNPKELLFKLGLLTDWTEINHWTCLNKGKCTKAWDVTREQLLRIKRQADTLGIPFIVMNIPAREQLPGGKPPIVADGSLPGRFLKTFTNEIGVHFIDFYANSAIRKEHFYPIDGHLQPEGHTPDSK